MSKQEAKNLIEKYLNNQCTAQEKELIAQWLDEYGSDQEEIIDGNPELQERLARIRQNLIDHATTAPQKKIISPTWKKYWKVAAIFIGLSIAGGYLITKNQPTSSENYITTSITPGTDKAFIQYDDDSPIQLNEDNAGINITDNHAAYTNGEIVASNDYRSDAAATTPKKITIKTPRGGQYRVTLPDGTIAWLNSDSKVIYLTAKNNNRELTMEGEIYLEVKHNERAPFLVRSKGQVIEVLGTKFNISSYPEEKETKTTLVQGKVKVTNLISNNRAVSILAPGQQSVLGQTGNIIHKNIDLEEITAWTNGYFKFNDPLNTVLKKLSRWYNADFLLEENIDPELLFMGKLSRKTELKDVMDIICQSAGLTYQIQGRRIMIKK